MAHRDQTPAVGQAGQGIALRHPLHPAEDAHEPLAAHPRHRGAERGHEQQHQQVPALEAAQVREGHVGGHADGEDHRAAFARLAQARESVQPRHAVGAGGLRRAFPVGGLDRGPDFAAARVATEIALGVGIAEQDAAGFVPHRHPGQGAEVGHRELVGNPSHARAREEDSPRPGTVPRDGVRESEGGEVRRSHDAERAGCERRLRGAEDELAVLVGQRGGKRGRGHHRGGVGEDEVRVLRRGGQHVAEQLRARDGVGAANGRALGQDVEHAPGVRHHAMVLGREELGQSMRVGALTGGGAAPLLVPLEDREHEQGNDGQAHQQQQPGADPAQR